MPSRKLYYVPARPSVFSTLNKVAAAVTMKNKSDVRAWLRSKMPTQVTELWGSVARYPYTVSNVMDVWECDLRIVLCKIQQYALIHSIVNRRILEISQYGPFKNKERTFHRLGVSIHNSRRRFPPPPPRKIRAGDF